MSGQRQDSTLDQLRDLIAIANLDGMYDAADYLRDVVARWSEPAVPPNPGMASRRGGWPLKRRQP